MKRLICLFVLAGLMTVSAHAVSELPKDLTENLPDNTKDFLEEVEFSGTDGFSFGFWNILGSLSDYAKEILHRQIKGAVLIFLIVLLCSLVEGIYKCVEGTGNYVLSMVATLSIVLVATGNMDSLIGDGMETIRQLREFSKILLPVLATATAGTGAVTTATFQQITVVVLVDLLLGLIHGLLVPLIYLYIGILAAASCLSSEGLLGVAEGMKKMIVWILSTGLILFTLYLSVVRVIAGNVDGTAVRMTKTAIAGMIPVVGGVIAEASETILAGAGLLKNSVGIFGTLAVLGICAYPFLQLGIQYLLYKMTAGCSMFVGQARLCKLIQGLGGAFGLVLGMTGSCALLLLVSVFSCIAAVLP